MHLARGLALFLGYSLHALTARAEEVRFENPKAPGVTLACTFARPAGDAPPPAALLIPGAGPQDRDETTADHKPLLVLADYLKAHNIATLRCDDRGVGQSTGEFRSATLQDFLFDAQAAIQFLASRTDVDQKHVGIIGHGQGAILASNLAAGLPQQISFLVLLSGTAVNGAKVLLAQMARAEIAAGVPEEKIDADQQIGAVLYRMAAAGRSESEMRQVLESAPEEYAPFLDFWRSQIPRLQSPWLRSFLIHDPSAALAQVKCPVLALFGQKDMTIDPEQNANAMKHAFSKAHNRGAKVKILPDLNYLFQKANTGMPGEYAAIRETMDPSVLEQIQSWIAMQVQ